MKVLFVCAGGMSSALVVDSLKAEWEKSGENIEVAAVGTSEFEERVGDGWDIAMVAPQVRHRFDNFNAHAKQANVPCILIPPQMYTPLGGKKLVQLLKEQTAK